MVQINFALREVNCKIVFYGPGRSGKTTNLEKVHEKAPKGSIGEMVSIATETDRTLFFDFLPLDLGTVAGMNTKFQLYTVPGQVYYNATRKLVLQGADGVVFVADSQRKMHDENIESLENLMENLHENGLDINTIPFVIQYNKRDLPDIETVAEMNAYLNRWNVPSFEAVAVKGDGVFATLKSLSSRVISQLNNDHGYSADSPKTTHLQPVPVHPAPAPISEVPAAPKALVKPAPVPAPVAAPRPAPVPAAAPGAAKAPVQAPQAPAHPAPAHPAPAHPVAAQPHAAPAPAPHPAPVQPAASAPKAVPLSEVFNPPVIMAPDPDAVETVKDRVAGLVEVPDDIEEIPSPEPAPAPVVPPAPARAAAPTVKSAPAGAAMAPKSTIVAKQPVAEDKETLVKKEMDRRREDVRRREQEERERIMRNARKPIQKEGLPTVVYVVGGLIVLAVVFIVYYVMVLSK